MKRCIFAFAVACLASVAVGQDCIGDDCPVVGIIGAQNPGQITEVLNARMFFITLNKQPQFVNTAGLSTDGASIVQGAAAGFVADYASSPADVDALAANALANIRSQLSANDLAGL